MLIEHLRAIIPDKLPTSSQEGPSIFLGVSISVFVMIGNLLYGKKPFTFRYWLGSCVTAATATLILWWLASKVFGEFNGPTTSMLGAVAGVSAEHITRAGKKIADRLLDAFVNSDPKNESPATPIPVPRKDQL